MCIQEEMVGACGLQVHGSPGVVVAQKQRGGAVPAPECHSSSTDTGGGKTPGDVELILCPGSVANLLCDLA